MSISQNELIFKNPVGQDISNVRRGDDKNSELLNEMKAYWARNKITTLIELDYSF